MADRDSSLIRAGIAHAGSGDPDCPHCGRPIQPGRAWCQYCGVHPEPPPAGRCHDQVRDESFRLRHHRWPFRLSAFLLGAAAAIFFAVNTDPAIAWVGWVLIALGPGRLVIRLLRAKSEVRILADTGILLPGGETLSWGQIRGAERRFGLIPPAPDFHTWSRWIRGITGLGDGVPMLGGRHLVTLVLFVSAALFAVHLVISSLLFSLWPWPHRVVLHLRNENRVSLPDPEEAGRLLRRVLAAIG